MMDSVATPPVAARGGHALGLAKAGQAVAMASTLSVARPASLSSVASPVATSPLAGRPHTPGQRRPQMAATPRTGPTEREGQA